MKKRLSPKYVLLAALGFGVLTAVLLVLYTGEAGNKEVHKNEVYVAARDIPGHTVIQADMVKKVSVPAEYVIAGAMNSEELIGATALAPIMEGEQIPRRRVAAAGGSGITAALAKDKRAVAVPIDAVGAVSGFVRPGDRVDVLAVMGNGGNATSRTILQDIEVLAVNTDKNITADQAGEAYEEAPSSVTLAVTLKEAQSLSLAKGNIMLALRPLDGTAQPFLPSIRAAEVIGYTAFPEAMKTGLGSAGIAPRRTEPAAAAPISVQEPEAPKGIIVYRGTKKSVE